MRKLGVGTILTLSILLLVVQSIFAQEENPTVVQAILFYSPSCPHCHEVITNHLPQIKEKFGDQFQLLGIDTSNQVGAQLYTDAVAALNIPSERLGVPTLIVGDVFLVGAQEIPEQLPQLIEQGLAKGGISWPDIPGLREAVPNLPPSAGSQSSNNTATVVPESEGMLTARVLPENTTSASSDPIGFAVGWTVIAFMALALIITSTRVWKNSAMILSIAAAERLRSWIIPTFALTGLGIASYLAYVEISRVEAVCGPIGECNVVQSSQYAQILGIPVAVLGLLFYVAVLLLWLIARAVTASWVKWIPTLLFTAAFLGTLFSIYLTLLELMVIEAVCAWCLSSAIVTTALLLYIVVQLTKSGSNLRLKGESKARFPQSS